ncbi:MAG: DJ-1/PfpI family protein [Eubacterium sp.]|nr:DJ-1/PfpI family protein [Eubacterium sp.]
MAKIYVFLADGLEEIEALTPVDLLRRAGDDVTTVSIMDKKTIIGGHDVKIKADKKFAKVDFSDGDVFILPGGGVGTENLEAHDALKSLLVEKYHAGKHIAAICAAPRYLGALGFLEGKKAVVYPGLEDRLIGADVQQVPAVTDGNVTTGHGPGAATDFAFELIRVLHGEETVKAIKEEFVYPY